MKRAIFFVFAAVVLSGCGAARVAESQLYGADYHDSGRSLPLPASTTKITYYFDESGGRFPSELRNDFNGALREWTDRLNNRFTIEETADRETAVFRVVFSDDRTKRHGYWGYTDYIFEGSQRTKAVLLFRTDLNRRDFRMIAKHEIGHALGIDNHSPARTDIMQVNRDTQQSNSLTQRDVNTIRKVYGL